MVGLLAVVLALAAVKDDAGAKDLGGAVAQGKMTAVQRASLAGTAGLVAMAADKDFVYAASKSSVVRVDALDLSHEKRIEIPNVRQLTALQVDGGSVYATAEMSNGTYRLFVLDKDLAATPKACFLPDAN